MQILKNMGHAGIKPDVIAYTTAIKVQIYYVEWAHFILWNYHALKLYGLWHKGTFPSCSQVCVESKNFMHALALYEEMKSYNIRPNLVSVQW